MKLIFVYNANSGMLSLIRDIGHKLMSPQTYDCFLCSLTHGTFREDPKWKAFKENSNVDMEFLHRNEFERKYGMKQAYPVVMKLADQTEVVLSRDQLSHLSSVDDLIVAVKSLSLQTN
ncbi:MAG: GTPase [Desulfocapsaceae bacterium]